MMDSSGILPLRPLLHQPWHICMTTAPHRLMQSSGYGQTALGSQQGLTTTKPFLLQRIRAPHRGACMAI